MKIILMVILLIGFTNAQNIPTFKDIKVYKGDYSIIVFKHTQDISSDSVAFWVKENRDDTTFVIAKYSSNAGGDTTQIDINGKNILVKLFTSNTSSLTPGNYFYTITDDSSTIYAGYFKLLSIGY